MSTGNLERAAGGRGDDGSDDGGGAPALLVSVHDVSPLTLDGCRAAVELLREAGGLRPRDLTLLVIPFHEGKARLADHPATVGWLARMRDAGATLALHGLTHRMETRAWAPTRWPLAYGFARGQAELYRADVGQVAGRLQRGRELLERAGLGAAARGFVPPAWLLSRAARRAVTDAGFAWFELFDGIHVGQDGRDELDGRDAGPEDSPCPVLGRRLIGWGSLNALEAVATVAYASWQRRRPPADTRLCVHPADMHRPRVRASIARAVRALRERLRPLAYRELIDQRLPTARRR